MTVWSWILVGAGGFFGFSLVIGLAVATILNNGGRELSELIELEAWTSAPLIDVNDSPVEDVAKQESGRAYSPSHIA
jgi:hypothetical protein